MTEILVLCTANVRRPPMAQAMLARELAVRRPPARVTSAGVAASGVASVPGEVAAVLAGYGLAGPRARGAQPDGPVGDGEPDDVPDPFGVRLSDYQRAAAQISRAVGEVADLGWGRRVGA